MGDIIGVVYLIIVIVVFTLICKCLCQSCSQSETPMYSTPVVITSQTHQPVGSPTAYPVQTNVSHSGYTQQPPSAMPMPQPYSSHPTSAPYPASSAPYPSGGQAPYPTGGAPYPTYGQASAPYPPQASMDPPPYNEVMGSENLQKQAPYNPGYSG
ncbi:CLUMA_CG005349, isoform A [Clunio marinus]|uniref:CLUMA_CG005349, isoform A n=1 Tax=Clunio marinus TaxID=568069 RepID=A0A1J1HYT5_9DIPT|nr:CLUMA_CG005349, isoform A [Clunio marinus]